MAAMFLAEFLSVPALFLTDILFLAPRSLTELVFFSRPTFTALMWAFSEAGLVGLGGARVVVVLVVLRTGVGVVDLCLLFSSR